MDLAPPVESALVDGCHLADMSIDWDRCFVDRVPQGIAFKLAGRQGIHPRALPLCGTHRELRWGFVMAGHVGRNLQP